MSLPRTSLIRHGEICATSPGQRVGSMLSPRSFKQSRPLNRKASATMAERSTPGISGETFIFLASLGTLFRESAAGVDGQFPTSQSNRLENPFVPERGLLVNLLVLLYGFGLFLFARTLVFTHHVGQAAGARVVPQIDNAKAARIWGSVLQSLSRVPAGAWSQKCNKSSIE